MSSSFLNNTRVLCAKHIAKGEHLTAANFRVESVQIDKTIQDGEILLRNIYLPLDPIVRYNFEENEMTTTPIGEVVKGFSVSEVIESKNEDYPVSSIVLGVQQPWEQYTRVAKPNLRTLIVIPDARNPKIPLTEYTNALGVNGLTAYAVAKTLVEFKKDQVIYVSSAAGPVGTLFAILAKRAGAFVIGSAGSDEKVQYLLNDIGIDAAFNYKTQDTRVEIAKAAAGGLDVYLDLVAGETLDIALEKLKMNGLVLSVGSISTVNQKTPYVVKNINLIQKKALRVFGFNGFQHAHRFGDMWKELGPLVASGEIKKQKETVVQGLANAPEAFEDYLDGKYHGKVIIAVAELEE
ncbi:hypothetical protein EDD11_001470 [Mortierella claussenii]|nr:hypothetical protein EDD11_001470 [Mortierella claussenii]